MAGEFSKSFLADDPDKVSPGAPRQIFLAGFGKHPGWDDHIEDIGLDTQTLRMTRTVLYIDGIGGEIDSAAWEKLEKGKQMDGFNHLFVWLRPNQMLIGRMWSSSDGKGRTRYPMIACAQCMGLPISWVMANVAPRLEALRQRCVGTKNAADVLAAFRETLIELRKLAAAQPEELSPIAASERERRQFLTHPAFGGNVEGLHRILYHMESQMAVYLPSKGAATTVVGGPDRPPRHIRVPRCVGSVEESARLWGWFFASQCVRSAPTLLLLPLEREWVDVVLGEPTKQEFFCLRASPEAIALVSDIPYTLDGGSIEKSTEQIVKLEQADGQLYRPGPQRSLGARVTEPASEFVGLLKGLNSPKTWKIVGGIFLVLALLALGVMGFQYVSKRAAQEGAVESQRAPAVAVVETNVSAQPAGADVGELVVTSKPAGAKFEWQGAVKTTPCTIKVPVSKVTSTAEVQLTARFGSLPEQKKTVVVEKDQQGKIEFVFACGSVRLESQPGGAAVLLDGVEVGKTPYASSTVAPGKVTYQLRLAGYNTVVVPLEVVADQTTREQRRLTTVSGTLVVRSEPDGAEVLQKGAVLGRTPFTEKMDVGRLELTLRHPVLGEVPLTAEVQENQTVTKEVRFPSGKVQLTSEPAGAEVLVGGKVVGKTPYENLMVSPGRPVTYEVRKEMSGKLLNEALVLQVVDGQILKTNVVLSSGVGFVVVTCNPAGTKVYLKTRAGEQLLGEAGAAPLRSQAIDKGVQKLVARHPKLGEQEVSVLVKSDAEVAAKVEFAYGNVVVQAEPASVGAEVFAGEKKLGRAPYREEMVKAGPVKFRVQAEDYVPRLVEGEVAAGQTAELVAKLELGQGTLDLKSDMEGAEAFLDNQPIGKLPLTKAAGAGAHQLVVKCRGEEQSEPLKLKRGKTETRKFLFGATLDLKGDLEGAEAFLDDQSIGKLPLKKLVTARAYQLRVTCPNKEPQSVALKLKRGETLQKEFFFGMLKSWCGMELVRVSGVPGTAGQCWVGKYEVTQQEYEKVMGANPSEAKNPRMPVVSVSFSDATEFCRKLTEKDADKGVRYTLPTDEQWDYLIADARLEDSVTSKGRDEQRKQPEPVGSTGKPNKLGLFDVRGNAMEWCDAAGEAKTLRGGDYKGISEIGTLGAGYKLSRPGGVPLYSSGFRCLALPAK